VIDPLFAAVGIGLLGSVAGGPAVAYGVRRVPQPWRRTAEWALIGAAVTVAIVADLMTDGPGGSGAVVYVLAVLPGLIAFLAWRSLLASTFVSLLPLYFVIAILTRDRPAHLPALPLDRALPVQPEWMLVYGSLYLFMIVLPLLVVRDPALFRRALQAYLAVMIVAYAGFALYPTTLPRPTDVPGQGFAAWSLRLLYTLDPPYNCFPSLHVAYSFVSALTCYRVHRGVGIAAVAWATLIGISTLFTKQHYVVDVVAGALSACVACFVFLRSYRREDVAESDRRGAPARALAVIGIFAIMVAGFWAAFQLQTKVY
jgi:membrane-associated phospholipid phosphatase